MNRRMLLALTAAGLLAPLRSMAEEERLYYEPGLAEAAMDKGEVILLDFFAPWCSTCRAQERVLIDLRGANSAYDEAITFITVDWDTHGNGELSRSLEVPRRSTLIALDGETELGRVVAGTGREEIMALLDAALEAAAN
jgi:thiol-disulfide isomerase/thioredoxin